MTVRPAPSEVADEATLLRWYWLRSELVDIARRLGVASTGGKLQLTERLAEHLAGRTAKPPTPEKRSHDLLPATLTGSTIVRPGQRCTQRLRAWLTAQVGPTFAFDGLMRDRVAQGDITLDGLASFWRATRGRPSGDIAPQFEFNRFARAWHSAHPRGDRAAMLSAWRSHRDAPRDRPE